MGHAVMQRKRAIPNSGGMIQVSQHHKAVSGYAGGFEKQEKAEGIRTKLVPMPSAFLGGVKMHEI